MGKGWKMKPAGPGCEPGHRLAAPQALGLPSGGWWRSRTSPRPAGRRGPTWQPPERPPLGARGGGGAGRGGAAVTRRVYSGACAPWRGRTQAGGRGHAGLLRGRTDRATAAAAFAGGLAGGAVRTQGVRRVSGEGAGRVADRAAPRTRQRADERRASLARGHRVGVAVRLRGGPGTRAAFRSRGPGQRGAEDRLGAWAQDGGDTWPQCHGGLVPGRRGKGGRSCGPSVGSAGRGSQRRVSTTR